MQQAIRATEPFDPAAAGTDEEVWLQALSSCREWTPQHGALVVVSPHPDDEVLAAGGLIHSWASAGRPVTVVSVTDGEAAFPAWQRLDLVRREELRGALRKLSLTHVSLIRVGLPDGKVAQYRNRLRNALLALIDPTITLIAPYERDGHPDHDAIGDVCCGLARSHGIDIARYPVWTWHHSEPASLEEARWVKYPLSLEARRAKARAIQCFASQLQPASAAPVVPRHVLTHFERSFEAFLI
jgi:LmbE family N-acetylglucosaminyl deacetylase